MITKLKNRIEKKVKDDPELVGKSGIALILRVFGFGCNYLLLLAVTRYFFAEGWGLFAICLTILNILALVGTLGINTGIVRMIADNHSFGYSLFKYSYKILIPLNAALTLLVFFGAGILSSMFKESESLVEPIRIIALGIIPFTMVRINAGFYRAIKMTWVFNFLDDVGRPVITLVLILILYQFNPSLSIIFYSLIGTYYIMFIASGIALIFILRKKGVGVAAKEDVKELHSISFSLFWAGSINRFSFLITVLFLGVFVDNETTGIYYTCERLMRFGQIILYAVNSISAPRFAELNKGQHSQIQKTLDLSSSLIFWFSVPIILLMGIFAKEILLFFGEEFVAGVSVLLWLLFGQLINNLTGSVVAIMQMTGYHKQYRNLTFITLITSIALNSVLIPWIGILGAGISVGTTIASSNLIAVYYVKNYVGLRTYYLPGFLRKSSLLN